MSVRLLCRDGPRVKVRETGPSPSVEHSGNGVAGRFQFWKGASGRRYLHSVFDIFDCPQIEDATYVLGRTDPVDGSFDVIRVGHLDRGAPSLNLAELRYMAAQSGARHVHLHFLAQDQSNANTVVFDIESALELGDRSVRSPAGELTARQLN